MRCSRVKLAPFLATAAMAATMFVMRASAARTPSVPILTASSSGRSLLGSGRLGAQPSPPPPPPPRLTPRETLANSLLNLVQSFLSAQGEAERDVQGGQGGGALGVDTDFNLTSVSTPFVSKLIAEARGVYRNGGGEAFVGNGDIIPPDVQRSLCESEFLRGGEGAGYNATEADHAYAAAHPLHRQGVLPVGCLTGCIVGGGPLETIARVYGVRRTGTPSSWRGKCFADEAVTQPGAQLAPGDDAVRANNATNATSPSVTRWQPGSLVTNRIKINYGVFINRLFGLDDPIELYPGKVYSGDSYFAPGERAVVIDYSDHDHEFSSFRDELREIYPGVYLGKMYALPGTELWGGLLSLPPDSDPRFAINFILFGQPGQTTVQAVQAPGAEAV